jgi:hypothetical protein
MTRRGWRGVVCAEVPEAQLTLEHVYGYGAPGVMSANLFVTDTEQVAFFTAGVGVVHDRTTNTQRFFLGHTDDVSSMALCPTAVALPGAPDRIPPRTLAATGQVTHSHPPSSLTHTLPPLPPSHTH